MKFQSGRLLFCMFRPLVYNSYHPVIHSSHTCSFIIPAHMELSNEISCSHQTVTLFNNTATHPDDHLETVFLHKCDSLVHSLPPSHQQAVFADDHFFYHFIILPTSAESAATTTTSVWAPCGDFFCTCTV